MKPPVTLTMPRRNTLLKQSTRLKVKSPYCLLPINFPKGLKVDDAVILGTKTDIKPEQPLSAVGQNRES